MRDTVELAHNALSLARAQEAVAHTSAGGLAFFIGTTRDNFEGKRVTWLEYEAYDEMALKQMKKLCTDARDKWADLVNIGIFHRIGRVPIGEASVIIAVSSPHRREAIGSYDLYTVCHVSGETPQQCPMRFTNFVTIISVCFFFACFWSLDACSWMIDSLKASVPIWKKEMYEDGSMWKANAEAFQNSKD